MNILVAKNGSQLGPFSESDIRAKLASGEFAPTDYGWQEGMSAWSPLAQMFAEGPAQSAAPAPYGPQGQYGVPQGQYSAPEAYNSPYPAQYQQGMMPQWGAPAVAGYAGFWLRLVALIIDTILLFVVNFCVGLVLGILFAMIGGVSRDVLGLVGNLIGIVVGLTYYSVMESSSAQATVGKMALGLRVTDLNGNRIGLGTAIGRYLGKIVSALTLFIGFIMAGFTARKQALHDMMAGTLVVRK